MLTQGGAGSGRWRLDPRKDPQDQRMEATTCEVCLGSTDLCFHWSAGLVEGKAAWWWVWKALNAMFSNMDVIRAGRSVEAGC